SLPLAVSYTLLFQPSPPPPHLPSFPTRRSSDLQHHPPLHLVLLHAAQKEPHVVPRLPLIQQLPEHLHPRHHHLLVRPKPHHLHFLPHLHLPSVDPSRRHRAPARDRKHVLHRHQERLLHLPLRHRNTLVQRRQQLV